MPAFWKKRRENFCQFGPVALKCHWPNYTEKLAWRRSSLYQCQPCLTFEDAVGLDRFFSIIAGYIDQYVVLPMLYHFGWMAWEELSFDWALICVYGMFAVIVTYAVCWPLEALLPVERWESKRPSSST